MKLIAAALSVAFLAGAYAFAQFVGSTDALIKRFPDVDPDVVQRIHKEMVLEALQGAYAGLSDDAEYDRVFRAKAAA